MPLTPFQKKILVLLRSNRDPGSHIAGGSAIHFEANSIRYSQDIDIFHDRLEKTNQCFNADKTLLQKNHFSVDTDIEQAGYIRATVGQDGEHSKIEWAYDSAWRFMPVQKHAELGYALHPVDLAVNKVLALAGRSEARDYIDTLYFHQKHLSLGALCWAAVGKDPGFTPLSLLELLKRKGKYREEDFKHLYLNQSLDLPMMKNQWLSALEMAENFISSRPQKEFGCLYYSKKSNNFYTPAVQDQNYFTHFGQIGGLIPQSV